jgi:hypothetical protein
MFILKTMAMVWNIIQISFVLLVVDILWCLKIISL